MANPNAKPRLYPTVDGILEGFVPKTVKDLRTERTEATIPPTFLIHFTVHGEARMVQAPAAPNGDIPIKELLTKIRLIAD